MTAATRRDAGHAMETSDAGLAERLADAGYGDARDLRALLPQVYAELKRIAHRQLFRNVPGATLSTTVLVHEAYARVAAHGAEARLTREHFLALSARVMRQIVIDHARARASTKRGGGRATVELAAADAHDAALDDALLALDDALALLERVDPRLLRLIEQHWFIGLDSDELVALTGLSLRTVQRELKRAKAWMAELLGP
ncbi:ECF-type sigma factor [Dokdonella sp.]|uniref:ECF-type sigma factor n=1 Tax=Dokdonella sp. TaxID=2291710 RepID=UPI002F42147D